MENEMDMYNRRWIIKNAQEILGDYPSGLTLRALHYRLVATRGFPNTIQHYKRVIGAMTKARWDYTVDMDSFIDRERTVYGQTESEEKDLDEEIEHGKDQIKAWMKAYRLNRWSNQPIYPEVFVEKKAVQSIFEDPCLMAGVALCPCKGFPSITYLNDASKRFKQAINEGKTPIILYYGDADPSGDSIPMSIKENLDRLGVDVELKRMALNPDQIEEMNLPGVPAKTTDSRTANWDGESCVELDAIEPDTLAQMCKDDIEELFDRDLYAELKDQEKEEQTVYQKALKEFVQNMTDDEEN